MTESGPDTKPVALWSVPRSISTAFERIFVERDDFEVLHEPFSASYYHSEDRRSDRYADQAPDPEGNYDRVLARVFEPRDGRVFLKDMAYQAKPLIDPGFVSQFVNTFIIRDPKYVLVSLYKMWPDFTQEEAGYDDLYRLFRLATRAGEEPIVVDAMSFSENPARVLSVYCERLGIPFQRGFAGLGGQGRPEVGLLGGLARCGRTEHRHKAGGPQRPRTTAGAGGDLRPLPPDLLRTRFPRDTRHGPARLERYRGGEWGLRPLAAPIY